jgi:putative ABC transport system permease protein
MKSFLLILLTLLRSGLQNPLQVMFALLAIIVGSGGLSAVLILNNAAQNEYRAMGDNSLGLPANLSAMISAVDGDEQALTQSDYSRLRQLGFTHAIAYAKTAISLLDGTLVNIVGIDAPALALFADTNGDPLALTENLLLSPDLYAQVEHSAQLSELFYSDLTLPELPILESPTRPPDGEHLIVMDLYYLAGFMQSALVNDESTFSLQIAVMPNNDTEMALLREALPSHLRINTVNQAIDPAAITQSLHLNLLAMSVVMFAVCFFVVVNALNLLLLGRLALFKTLRQLGISRWQLIIAQVSELAVYAVIGACVGVFAGHYLAVLLAPTLALTLAGLFDVNLGFAQLDSVHLALPMMLLCLVAMLLAALLPYQQLNTELSQKRSLAPISANKRYKPIWLFLASILITSGSAVWLPDSQSMLGTAEMLDGALTATFITIGCLIMTGVIGLFLIYPVIIISMTNIAERYSPLWHWSFAHSLIVANKTKLASAAFMIALVTHIGMTLMVDSFRGSTQAWLEQRLVADYYTYADSMAIKAAQARLEERGIRHFARYQIETQVRLANTAQADPQTLTVYSYPHQNDYKKVLLVDAISQDAWQAYKSHTGIFINQQFAIRNDLDLDDRLVIQINGISQTMAVKAIYMDYGNPYPQALIAPEIFAPTANTQVMAIHTGNQDMLTSLASILPTTANLYSRDQILSVSMQAFDKTFLITDALNIVTLLVAVFSLTTSIVLLEQKNRYVSALLRSFGVSKLDFTLALFSQYGLLCLIAALWAIPFGIGFAWLLVTRLNVFAFQWQFPLTVDMFAIINAVGISLVFVLALAAIPIFKRQQFAISEQLTCTE